MKPKFIEGDRVELMATYLMADGSRRQVVDDRGTVVRLVDDFTCHVKLDGEVDVTACFMGDLRPLNALDLLVEKLVIDDELDGD